MPPELIPFSPPTLCDLAQTLPGGAGGPSLSRTLGTATGSTKGALRGKWGVAHRCRGLARPEGTGVRGPSKA